jgi:Predicted membrane protein (DUF2214)
MAIDLHLAIAHHLLIFILFGILVSELVIVRQSMTGDDIKRIAGIDLWYGIVALLIVIVGFSRAVFAAKGWDYYSVNGVFLGENCSLCAHRAAVHLADGEVSQLAQRFSNRGQCTGGWFCLDRAPNPLA